MKLEEMNANTVPRSPKCTIEQHIAGAGDGLEEVVMTQEVVGRLPNKATDTPLADFTVRVFELETATHSEVL